MIEVLKSIGKGLIAGLLTEKFVKEIKIQEFSESI